VPRPDAVSTLEELHRRGFRLGMISNASSEMSALWAESTFEPLFDAVLFSADERMMKPDPRLYALERDNGYLLKGNVFTQDVIDAWLEYKRAELPKISMRPHPYEFHLYFDA